MALNSTKDENIRSLSSILFDSLWNMPQAPVYEDFSPLFDMLTQAARTEPLIFVIDEYPYLAHSYPGISSLLQKYIDHDWKDTKLKLILCGSSMSFMEHQVLGYQSPLYGRRTGQIRLSPLTFFETCEYFQTFSFEDQAAFYAMTGGIPEYIVSMNTAQSVKENILNVYMDPIGRLYEEPNNLLLQELRDPSTYRAIIHAVADGATKVNEIANRCKLESGACVNLLQNLISLDILKKEIPITETKSKKTLYFLKDEMFRFWFTFVYPNMSLLNSGLKEIAFDKNVEPYITSFMGYVFENICIQYMTKSYMELPFSYLRIGRWWGNNPKLKREEEIDILAYDQEHAIFGECKWWNQKVDMDVLKALQTKAELFHYKEKYYYLFSKSGFTTKLIDYSKTNEHITLVTLEDMMK